MHQSVNGIVLASKPAGITSATLTNRLKKALQIKKVGHTGTLDKFADGLMILVTGKATPLADYFLHQDKSYRAVVRVGSFTDTHDPEGEILKSATPEEITRFIFEQKEELKHAIEGLIQTKEQTPPDYSALKKDGVRYSDLARKGMLDFEIEKRAVTIYSSTLLNIDDTENTFTMDLHVSSGTYIRSIVRDLSFRFDFPMHLQNLTRTRLGDFSLSDEKVWNVEGEVSVLSPAHCLGWSVAVVSLPELRERVARGMRLKMSDLCFQPGSQRRMVPPLLEESKQNMPHQGENFFLVDESGETIAWAVGSERGYEYKRVFI